MKLKKIMLGIAASVATLAQAYEYDVCEPQIMPQCKGATQGAWTLDWEAALAKAKSEGKCTLVLFTGSWWCPYCHTIEDLVLTSKKWQDYVAEKGFYLAELDYSYRYAVPEGQEWKSYYPDATEGWGFKCWYMNPEFLAANNITTNEGLQLIEKEYKYQGEMALPGAAQFTMKTWDGSDQFTYGRIAYACIVVIGPDGAELGRVDFPWHSKASVTASEAQEFEIQSIEKILNGECTLCGDVVTGVPDVSKAQKYLGWLVDAEGGTVGKAEFKTGRANAKGLSKVSGKVVVNGRSVTFKSVDVASFDEPVAFERSGVKAEVRFGANGIEGFASGEFGSCEIAGGRDVFSAKDADAVAKAKRCPSGTWSLVVKTADASVSPFSAGYGALSLRIGSRGSTTVKGYLGDGTKVSVSTKAIVGEDGISCVPVRADLYGKKGGLGFVAWFKDGRLFSVENVSQWVADGRNGKFAAEVGVLSTTSSGYGSVEPELDFTLSGIGEGDEINGRPVVVDPTYDFVEVKGLKWRGTEATMFSARCYDKSGLLDGSMVFYTGSAKKPRKVKGSFKGIVMGGAGYGTVVVGGVGSWAVKITACGSCSD